MKPERLDPGSALSGDTRFRFTQQDSLVAAECDGGSIHRGYLVGLLDGNTLELRYVQLSRDGAGTNVFVQCADHARQP